MAKVEQMCSPVTLISEVSILTEKMRCIEKEFTKNDNIVMDRMKYQYLSENIIAAVDELDKDLFEGIAYIEAKTQADNVICYEAVNGNCSAAISSDGDFIVLGGERMLLIRDFNYIKQGSNKIKNTATNFEIASSHLSVLSDAVCDCLHHKIDIVISPKNDMNILETNDYRLRTIIALGVGCDVLCVIFG